MLEQFTTIDAHRIWRARCGYLLNNRTVPAGRMNWSAREIVPTLVMAAVPAFANGSLLSRNTCRQGIACQSSTMESVPRLLAPSEFLVPIDRKSVV